MSSTAIVSKDTLQALLEAHASMAAWYYELSRTMREGGPIRTPDEAARLAFLARLAADFPELASMARAIEHPRMYIPPPPAVAPGTGATT
ncbi:MAG: hypothetical protein U0271_42610 [Polyangiaceae bacterium]